MNETEIHERLVEISYSSWDPEKAHSLEDRLFVDFVSSLTNREDKIGELAKLVMKSKSIAFPRWAA